MLLLDFPKDLNPEKIMDNWPKIILLFPAWFRG